MTESEAQKFTIVPVKSESDRSLLRALDTVEGLKVDTVAKSVTWYRVPSAQFFRIEPFLPIQPNKPIRIPEYAAGPMVVGYREAGHVSTASRRR